MGFITVNNIYREGKAYNTVIIFEQGVLVYLKIGIYKIHVFSGDQMSSHSFFKTLKFVTGNPNKVREAGQMLALEVEQANLEGLIEVQTNDLSELVRHKLNQAYEVLKCPVMVEDSALIFSAWNGLPGALVKWFEKSVGCEGMIRMLEPFGNRSAIALCHVAVHDGSRILIAKGEVKGTIANKPCGKNGFGWDVIFIPEGRTQTFAEMSPEDKNAISHRCKAFEELKEMLRII